MMYRGEIQTVEVARAGRSWIWFFVALLVLTLTAIFVQIWYNAGQQLTWQRLEAAEQLWKERGPADYDLDYSVKKLDNTENYHAEVRHKTVVAASLNSQGMEERLLAYQDMPHLFGYIERFWQQDHDEGKRASPRTFVTAVFDAQDGHLLHYVRSVMTTRERVEITVTLRSAGKGE